MPHTHAGDSTRQPPKDAPFYGLPRCSCHSYLYAKPTRFSSRHSCSLPEQSSTRTPSPAEHHPCVAPSLLEPQALPSSSGARSPSLLPSPLLPEPVRAPTRAPSASPPPARHGAPLSALSLTKPTHPRAPPRAGDAPRPEPAPNRLPERRLRRCRPPPGAGPRGQATSGHLLALQTPLQVRADLLFFSPLFPLAAGEHRRWKSSSRALLCSKS